MFKKYPHANLWMLWFLCLLPIVLAMLLYYTPGTRWLSINSNGILLQAPISVAAAVPAVMAERKSWQLWYVVDTACDKQCQVDLAQLRNAHQALGKDRPRVALRTIGPQMTIPFLTPGTLAIVDPLDWLIMYYKPGMPYKGMLSDLRRLLKYSHVG